MNMLRHNDISYKAEVKFLSHLINTGGDNALKAFVGEKRNSTMGTEGYKACTTIVIVMPKLHDENICGVRYTDKRENKSILR